MLLILSQLVQYFRQKQIGLIDESVSDPKRFLEKNSHYLHPIFLGLHIVNWKSPKKFILSLPISISTHRITSLTTKSDIRYIFIELNKSMKERSR